MKISFIVNPVFDGWEPTSTRLGGTERGVVEWAEELVKRGWEVYVFRNPTVSPVYEHNGVQYRAREFWGISPDVTINVKSSDIPANGPTLYYTNELNASELDLSTYDGVIHISNWAKKHIPVDNRVFVVPHGYDPETHYPDKKIPKQCLYSSSPDRGLEVLLRAWPAVHEAHPDATLKVTYGAEYTDIPGVEFLGDVSEEEMAKLYRESDIWCHPNTGVELQCIAAAKAQASGCWPVVIPAMALSETVKYGTFADKDNYTHRLITALNGHPTEDYQGVTIVESTNMLLGAIQYVLTETGY